MNPIKYVCQVLSPLLHNGVKYVEDEIVHLEQKIVEELHELGVIKVQGVAPIATASDTQATNAQTTDAVAQPEAAAVAPAPAAAIAATDRGTDTGTGDSTGTDGSSDTNTTSGTDSASSTTGKTAKK